MSAATRLALFDLDGTLVDSVADIHAALSAALAELDQGAVGEGQVRGWIGNGIARLVERALAERGAAGDEGAAAEPVRRCFERHYRRVNGTASTLYPGAREVLARLRRRGTLLGCVTNKPRAPAAELLRHLGLAPYFDLLLGGDSVCRGKPDPEPLRRAACALRTPLASTVMIGDSVNDVRAARAAPCRIICVSYGYNHGRDIRTAGADAVIDSFDELDEQLDMPRRVR